MNILKFSGWDSGLNLTNSSWKLQSQQSYKSTTLQFKKLKENKTEQFDQLLKKNKASSLETETQNTSSKWSDIKKPFEF